jgi:isopenicillin N synthase-like dioxygenase
MAGLPVVRLDDFLSDSPRRQQSFVEQFGRSLEQIGFVAVEQHTIDDDLLHLAYQCAGRFFDEPVEVKRRYERPQLKGQRGFTSFGREHAKDAGVPDLKEFYQIGRDHPPDLPQPCHYGPNIWPEEVPEFGPVMSRLYRELEELSGWLLDACSLYLGEERGLLRGHAAGSDSILRLIHYPPIPDEVPPACMRSAAHEDINLITLLCGSTADGLQVLCRDGQWLSVAGNHRQIIVDSGDMLQNLTNGLLKSTTHRVVNPPQRHERRFSMPFFAHPRKDVNLQPLPACVDRTGGEVRYAAITAGDYLEQRLREIGF